MSQTQATLNKLYEDYPHIDTILDIAQLYTDYQQKKYAYPWIQKALNENPDNLEAWNLWDCTSLKSNTTTRPSNASTPFWTKNPMT